MAEVLFEDLLSKTVPESIHWQVDSAGCWATNGNPATNNAINVMAERGLDLSDHSSKPVIESLLAELDLILCMEKEHRTTIRRNFPEVSQRTFLLSEMVNEEIDVLDPVGYPEEAYRKTAEEIQAYLVKGFERILQLIY